MVPLNKTQHNLMHFGNLVEIASKLTSLVLETNLVSFRGVLQQKSKMHRVQLNPPSVSANQSQSAIDLMHLIIFLGK